MENKMYFQSALNSLVGTGLIEEPEGVIYLTDEPKIPAYACFPSRRVKSKYYIINQFGNGFDENRIVAKIKSAGELLERLCLFNPDKRIFFVSKYSSNKDKLVDPESFRCYSGEQLGDKRQYLKRIRNEEYRWWPVENISTGKNTFIPAQLVFLSLQFSDEFPIRKEMISTGAALGPIGENHAFKTGFLESIERDASISAYLKKKHLARVTNLPDEIVETIVYLGRYQLEPYIFDITTDLEIPSSLVVTLDRTGLGPAVCVGASSNFKHKDAIKEALLESIQWRGVSRLIRKFHLTNLPKENEIDSMTRRFFYWYSLERIEDLNFWLESSNKVNYNKLAEGDITEDEAVNKIKSRGYNIFSADITLPEVRKQGFEGKKVIIPELHPLYLDENFRALYSIHYGEIKYNKTLKPHPIS